MVSIGTLSLAPAPWFMPAPEQLSLPFDRASHPGGIRQLGPLGSRGGRDLQISITTYLSN